MPSEWWPRRKKSWPIRPGWESREYRMTWGSGLRLLAGCSPAARRLLAGSRGVGALGCLEVVA